MKVYTTDASFTDASRGERVTRWKVTIELEGVILFSQIAEKQIPYSPGYSGNDFRCRNRHEAKQKTVQVWSDKILATGSRY